jgi:hypothetical protein
MNVFVLREGTGCSAGIVTHLTLVGLLSSMGQCVSLEVTGFSAGIVTDEIFVRLLPGMDVFVVLEVTSRVC